MNENVSAVFSNKEIDTYFSDETYLFGELMVKLLFTSLIQNLFEIGYEVGFTREWDNTKAVSRLRYIEPIDIRVGREPVTRAIELAYRPMGCHRPRGSVCVNETSHISPASPFASHPRGVKILLLLDRESLLPLTPKILLWCEVLLIKHW